MATDLPVLNEALSPQQQDVVRRALADILQHACFRSTERCSRLLRYIVEAELNGQENQLKERIIGHEVFGRQLTYETSSDPVVRNAASELRRRLTQYSHETEGNPDVRINLPPGSYVPRFLFRAERPVQPVDVGPSQSPVVGPAPPVNSVVASASSVHRLRVIAGAGLAALLVVVLAFAIHMRSHKGAVAAVQTRDPFWSPVTNSDKQPLISVEGSKPIDPPQFDQTDTGASLPFVDAKAYGSIAGLLARNGKTPEVRLARDTNFAALRDRPVVLIGGFRNPWTMRLTANARYHVLRDETHIWIEDAQHPGVRTWNVDWQKGVDHSTDTAYALVSRVRDPTTGGTVVTLTGLGTRGTELGSEFLARSEDTQGLSTKLLDPNQNVELVLKTVVVDGATGTPQVVATYIW